MSFSDRQMKALREAFVDAHAGPTAACPDPEVIWDASHGNLAKRETLTVVEHVAGCSHCALAWRIGLELEALEDEPGPEPVTEERGFLLGAFDRAAEAITIGRLDWRTAAISAMALLTVLAAISLTFTSGRAPTPPATGLRNPESIEISTLVSEDEPLPRDAFALAWRGAPEGATYDVTVTTAELDVIARAIGLEEARFIVPRRDLAELESGAEVLWQVEAALPDGGRVRSDTFVARIR